VTSPAEESLGAFFIFFRVCLNHFMMKAEAGSSFGISSGEEIIFRILVNKADENERLNGSNASLLFVICYLSIH
jgi:hypothetical protein